MTARKANGQFTAEPAFTPGIADWPRFDTDKADTLLRDSHDAAAAYIDGINGYQASIDGHYPPQLAPVILLSDRPVTDAAYPALLPAPVDDDPELTERVNALMAAGESWGEADPVEEDDPAKNVHVIEPNPLD